MTSCQASCLRLLPVFGVALLAGVGSLSAVTYTWDPDKSTIGTNDNGTWSSSSPIFATGGKDVDFPNKGAGTIYFGTTNTSTSSTTNNGAGTVMVADPESAGTIRFYPTASASPGYTFTQVGTSTAGSISTTNMGLYAPGTATTSNVTTIDVPLTVTTLDFNVAYATLSLGANSTIGIDSATSTPAVVSPNIIGNSLSFGGQATLSLNQTTAGAATTYVIGTSIAIGNTSTATGGVQVNTNATLVTSTASGALNDLGVGGYAALNMNGASNGSGLLTINGGAVTTNNNVYINDNTGTGTSSPTTPAPVTTALSGRLIVSSGSLTVGNQIYIGNLLGPASGVTQSAEMDVNGGVVLLTNNGNSGTQNGAILLNNAANAAGGGGTATLNIAGGVTTLGVTSGIIFNAGSSTTGSSKLNMTGGSLFVGGNGLINSGGAGSTLTVNLSGGTVGALANWTDNSSVPINLLTNGNVTFQTSNANSSTSATATVPANSANTATITLSGVVSGAGSLTTTSGTPNSGGLLILNAANTYTGTTTVSGGTLLVNGSIGTNTPAGTLTVNGGGTLAGPGVLSVTSASVAGTLAPGALGATSGPLTLNTTNGLTLSGTLLIGVAGTSPSATSTVLSTNSQLTLSGAVLTVNGTLDGMSSYEVASYGTLSGTFASANVPANYFINYEGDTFAAADIELDLAPVPEPSVWAGALLGLGWLGWSHRRRHGSASRTTTGTIFA